ncbi:MAG: hypothetical protein OEU26_16835 [Candidatus Tectomicrobia bacterium]|nr:hypothetical protein [Candidatus Tectomicrobia bacterium]
MRLVCRADTNTLDAYIERRTDQQVVFAIGAMTCRIGREIVASHDTLYFHIEEQGGEVLNVIVDTVHRQEFSHCPERELLQTFAPPRRAQEPTQDRTKLFSAYMIEHVEIREPSIVALEAAIEKLATELQDVAFRVRADGAYLIKEGTAVKLDSGALRTLVEEYLQGRRLADLHENKAISHLVSELGLIQRLRLSRPEDDLSAIFG